MDEILIDNWNLTVDENDIVFDLGDFAFAPNRRWKEILERLNGQHYLILGNHDIVRLPDNSILNLFKQVGHQMILKINGRTVYLNHYPFLCYGGSYKNPDSTVYTLHGHLSKIENSGKDFERMINTFPSQYDVGVDFNNYRPISWEEVRDKISFQTVNNVNQIYLVNK